MHPGMTHLCPGDKLGYLALVLEQANGLQHQWVCAAQLSWEADRSYMSREICGENKELMYGYDHH